MTLNPLSNPQDGSPLASPAPAAASGASMPKLTPLEPVRIVRQYFWWLLIAALVGIVIGTGMYYAILRTNPVYQTGGQILVQPPISDPCARPGQEANTRQSDGFLRREIVRMQSRDMLRLAMQVDAVRNTAWFESFDSVDDAVEALRTEQLSVGTIRGTSIVEINMTGNRPDELRLMEIFQNTLKRIRGADTVRFQEFIVRDETADLRNVDVLPYILADRPTVFIIPSYNDESFVYSMLRKLKIATLNFSEVVVYGFPQWMEYDRVDFDLYEDLEVHVSSAFYVDDYAPEIQEFKRRFFDEYGTPPHEEAYIGYESTLYFGRLVAKYGNQFIRFLPVEDRETLYTNYRFREIYNEPPGPVGDPRRQAQVERYENTFVQILKFQDYYFQPAE